jgi:hypothetical protein
VFVNRTFDELDSTNVSDERVLAGGRDFCDRFAEIARTNTDKNLLRPNIEDFGPTAQGVASSRFMDVQRPPGSPGQNGPILMAYFVGKAAVKELCPEFEAALG